MIKIEQYIYQLAEVIELKPVDSISVHSNLKQRTVLPTEKNKNKHSLRHIHIIKNTECCSNQGQGSQGYD